MFYTHLRIHFNQISDIFLPNNEIETKNFIFIDQRHNLKLSKQTPKLLLTNHTTYFENQHQNNVSQSKMHFFLYR